MVAKIAWESLQIKSRRKITTSCCAQVTIKLLLYGASIFGSLTTHVAPGKEHREHFLHVKYQDQS